MPCIETKIIHTIKEQTEHTLITKFWEIIKKLGKKLKYKESLRANIQVLVITLDCQINGGMPNKRGWSVKSEIIF